MGFSERMRVNPIFFPDTTRLQIPNFANRDTTIRKDYQEHLPKSLFLTSPNKLKKNQTRQLEPSSQMQSSKVKTAESNYSNTRTETHNFNALSIRKWLHQVEKSSNESNQSIWDYLFPGLVFPTESTLIRKDSNSSAFVGIHNENQQVLFLVFYILRTGLENWGFCSVWIYRKKILWKSWESFRTKLHEIILSNIGKPHPKISFPLSKHL